MKEELYVTFLQKTTNVSGGCVRFQKQTIELMKSRSANVEIGKKGMEFMDVP